jgi:small subunit ribosomal protein S3Ae
MSQKSKKKRRKGRAKKKVSFKEKSWYKVIAPKSFNYEEIGDIIGVESNLMDRTVETLLYDFTDDYDDINCKLIFKVIDLNEEGKQVNTILTGHEYTSDYVRSLVGRGASKITTINNFTTKDDFVYRLTTVCVTIRRARSSQMDIIRKVMRDILSEFAKSLRHEKFVKGMISGEFANQIKRVAKTIYPLSSSTIIKSKLISMPEGAKDTEVPDEEFDVVEVEVKRSRKSEIKRSERINVKNLQRGKRQRKKDKEIEEEELDEEDLEELEEEIEEEEVEEEEIEAEDEE